MLKGGLKCGDQAQAHEDSTNSPLLIGPIDRMQYLDASVAQELLHAVPGGISLAHELEHALKHVSDGIRRRFQGADFIEVVRLDLANSQAGSFDDGRHHCQL